jgi:protein pelota
MKFELNEKEKEAKITIQSYDDLFYLYLLIEEGDELYGWSYRNKKIYSKEGKAERAEKERVYLGISVEKAYFHPSLTGLKVIGSIIYRPENFEASGHHSFLINIGDTIKLKKEDWSSALIQSIIKEIRETYPKSIIISVDYGNIAIALLHNQRFQIIYSEEKSLGGKREISKRDEQLETFLKVCIDNALEIISKTNPELIILYGPSNLKDIIYERIKKIERNIFRVSGSIGGIEGIYEALRNEEVLKILTVFGHEESMLTLEPLLSKAEKIAMGIKEVKEAASLKAIDKLFISTKLLKNVSKEELNEIKKISEQVKIYGGSINIVDEESEAGKTLEKLGNIIALLRFNLY